MAKVNISMFLVIISLVLSLSLCSCNGRSISVGQKDNSSWCIASAIPKEEELQKTIDYGCSKIDCSPIQPGGACFEPNGVRLHVSWVIDKFYRENGQCPDDIGFFTKLNPSYGNCQYP